ncbi:MAG TPA: TetR/AcrR family transcriptional regulator [Clostridia bacterium]|nr:TetR/AcrR family transcriptional regulator [Clostridia bacterium]
MNTREKILETAIDMFSVKGYNDVSIRDITRAVGIKESSLYNHFTSKQQILDEIFEYLVRQFDSMTIPGEEAARLIEEADPEEFMEMCLMNFRMYFGDPKLIRIWRIISIERFRNKQANDFFLYHFIDYPFEYQAKVFEAMMKKGLIIETDPMVLARESYSFMLMIYLRYFAVDSVLKNPVDDPLIQQMIREHMQFLLRAMAKK